jgi:hypothetical protein
MKAYILEIINLKKCVMKIFFALLSMLVILSMLYGCAPALMMAAYRGDINAVKDELDKGADVNEKDLCFTALMRASDKGYTDIVKLLIERGADVNIFCKPPRYHCALGWAARSGHTDIMDILVDRGADIDIAIENIKYLKNHVSRSGVNYLYKLKKKALYNAELAKLNEFETVARQYREAHQKPPFPEEAIKFKVQAEFAFEQKRYADATNLYAAAIKVAPWEPELHYNRAIILATSELSNYREAIMEMKKYLMLAPNASYARDAKNNIYKWESMIK